MTTLQKAIQVVGEKKVYRFWPAGGSGFENRGEGVGKGRGKCVSLSSVMLT